MSITITSQVGDVIISESGEQIIYEANQTVIIPAASSVLSSEPAYGLIESPITGTYVEPDQSYYDTAGPAYGPNGTISGTQNVAGLVAAQLAADTASFTAQKGYYLNSGPSLFGVNGTATIPTATDTRSGVTFGVSGNSVTGSCAVPSANRVSLGVAVDNTTGTGIVTAQDVADAMALSTSVTPATGSPLKLIQDTKSAAESVLSAISGIGAYTVTLALKDNSANLLSGVSVSLTKGAERVSSTTNSSGVVMFNVDAGSWVLAAYKSGYEYDGSTLSIFDDYSSDITMDVITLTPATDPGACVIYDTTRDTDDSIKSGVVYTYNIVDTNGSSMNGTEKTATSVGTSDNNISFTIQRGCEFMIKRGTGSYVGPLTVPDLASTTLLAILGTTTSIIGPDS